MRPSASVKKQLLSIHGTRCEKADESLGAEAKRVELFGIAHGERGCRLPFDAFLAGLQVLGSAAEHRGIRAVCALANIIGMFCESLVFA